MPESAQYPLRNTTPISYLMGMESPLESFETILEESFTTEPMELDKSSARAMSVESLNTLLTSLPEISIPPTLYNPLPLQCLAANALPESVRNEIDGVIAKYSDLTDGDSGVMEALDKLPVDSISSRCAVTEQEDCISTVTEQVGSDTVDKDIETLTAALHKALGMEVC